MHDDGSSGPEAERGTAVIRAAEIAVFGALLLAHVWFVNELPNFRQPNTFSRLYLTLAMVEQGSFVVDDQLARYGPIEDLAQYAGHHYSDKPPGSSLLLAPIAWMLRHTFLPISTDPRPMLVALRLLGVSLPAVLFWFLTRRYWYELAGGTERGLAVILVAALGTPFFVYATQLFSHAMAALLAFAGFLAIRSAAQRAGGEDQRIVLAGLCLGLALVSDFVLLLAVPVLAIYAVLCRRERRGRRLVALAGGALLPAVFLGVYDQVCFGSPWSIGAHHLVDPGYRERYARGFYGIQAPDAWGLLEITLLPRRGLVYLSPVLLLAPFGLWRAWRLSERRAEALAAAAAAGAILLFATTTVDWTGGWGVGCRYLVPAIPFLWVGVASAVRDAPAASPTSVLFRGLACVGFVTIGLAAASFPYFPPEFESPTWQLAWPLLVHGQIMPSLLGGTGAAAALLPFAILLVGAMLFVLVRAWPRTSGRDDAALLLAVVLAVGVLWAMRSAAPPVTSDLQGRALALVLQILRP